ncbi:MAG: TRAP transporter large permease [Candidatus Methylomirabilota bacterium]|jgi:C4-dicarboxylate transporter DctM subunit
MLIHDFYPFAILFPLIALRVPIGFGLLLSGLFTSWMAGEVHFLSVVRIFLDAPKHYTLLAIPFFILTADLLEAGGLITLLFEGLRAWLGRLPGGLGSVTVAGTMIFGGISGSSAADAAAFSKIGTAGMSAQGFRREFSACLVASSGTLAIMVPPSIAMLIYGSLTDTSIGALAFGGLTPGILFGLILMTYVAWVARRQGIGLDERKYTWAERRSYSLRLLPIFGILFLVLWGFYTGKFMPTEVSTMSALASLLVALFIYRSLHLRDIPRVLAKTVRTSAAIFLIIAGATVFAKSLTVSGFTARAVALIRAADLAPWQFMLGVTAILYFLGCFMEGVALNVMTTPMLAPIAQSLGIGLVQYGLFLIFNIEVALISPPVGLNVSIVSAATGVPLEQMYRRIWPFIIILEAGVMIMIFFPSLALWLPRLIYGP